MGLKLFTILMVQPHLYDKTLTVALLLVVFLLREHVKKIVFLAGLGVFKALAKDEERKNFFFTCSLTH